jgi:pimeloyl-ACP methyl ester carboxylesterase
MDLYFYRQGPDGSTDSSTQGARSQPGLDPDPSAIPILCLHGHPGSGASMAVFTDHLSRNRPTIAPDLRGYGRSKTRQAFAMPVHLEDIEALLDQLGIDQCLVLGWSLGGIMAMELALKLPDRVQGLILVATAARPYSDHPRTPWWTDALTAVAGLINWVKPGWQWNIDWLGRRSLFQYLVQQHTPETYRYLARYGTPAFVRTSPLAHRALNQALRQFYNRTSDLPRIHCPALVLAGECDRHITAAASHQTYQNLPNAEWVCYPATAHLFPWEIPDQVLATIDDWLTRQSFGPNP